MATLNSCKKARPDYPLNSNHTIKISPQGSEISFRVPSGHISLGPSKGSFNYSLSSGIIEFFPESVESSETLYFTYFVAPSSKTTHFKFSSQNKGLAYFNTSATQIKYDALVKFPVDNINLLNSFYQFKPYRIKVDNIWNITASLNDLNRWEEIPIAKIDTAQSQLHFYTREFGSYIYCIAKRVN